ncbi:MAG: AMP-binding protein [Muribaculaceae bacterium]|nr:AMP-binding protein [Muribaculaceae bacterium]
MLQENLLILYANSFRDNWDLPALTDYTNGHTLTYGDFAREIARFHQFYSSLGIKQGDKIALIGKNNLNWVTVFMSTITYGAVIVPILQEFNPQDAQHIINHSDSVLLFASDKHWESFELDKMPQIRAAISLDDRRLLAEREDDNSPGFIDKTLRNLNRRFKRNYPNGFTASDIKYPYIHPDTLAIINYTSGTTGFSKGVMLTLNNICGNVIYGGRVTNLHYRGCRCLSFLPLAHAYGCAFDLLSPLAAGSHITLFGRVPSPKLLLKALAEIKPNLVICVPLILEKIYKKQILPMITKQAIRWTLAIPFIDKALYYIINKKLVESFGGEFQEIIVGGAPLNAEVEEFLHRIKFPFTVGYGMTECAPLISHTKWDEFIPGSSGRTLKGIMESKIDSPDPENIPGEILVRGENRMMGYYKNAEATAAAIDKEGWLHTGDMGTRSADGTIFIRGRYKTMLLSANGQNIYPEEIESKLNNMPFVQESLVVDRSGKLVALVYPDYEAMDANGLTAERLPEMMEQVRKELNKIVAPYEQISRIQLIANEFEKTPKRSIKRYLYSN